jgi:hypothetical protein
VFKVPPLWGVTFAEVDERLRWLRSGAESRGLYQGVSAPSWYADFAGDWVSVWLRDDADPYPEAARVEVYRKGVKRPTVGLATWSSFSNLEVEDWQKRPEIMLALCAEALALERAFPPEMGDRIMTVTHGDETRVFSGVEVFGPASMRGEPEPEPEPAPAPAPEPAPQAEAPPTGPQPYTTEQPHPDLSRGIRMAFLDEDGFTERYNEANAVASTWEDSEDAVTWAMSTGVFTHGKHAANSWAKAVVEYRDALPPSAKAVDPNDPEAFHLRFHNVAVYFALRTNAKKAGGEFKLPPHPDNPPKPEVSKPKKTQAKAPATTTEDEPPISEARAADLYKAVKELGMLDMPEGVVINAVWPELENVKNAPKRFADLTEKEAKHLWSKCKQWAKEAEAEEQANGESVSEFPDETTLPNFLKEGPQ